MRIYGQAMAGGPMSAVGLPAPTTPLSRPGSDIVSRLEAAHARVSPVGASGDDGESRAYNLGRNRKPAAAVRYDRVEIAARYRRFQSAPQIAKALGCTTATVYAALKDQGVETRPTGGSHKSKDIAS